MRTTPSITIPALPAEPRSAQHAPADDESSGNNSAGSGRTVPIRDRGQATTEYALVLLAAALVGLLVIGWATSGGGAAAVGRLFERVIESVIDKV
jgi:hypothetical protein